MDIDHFKHINDTYGHHVGDDVLSQLAKILREQPEPVSAYRFGGEEFLMLLPQHDAIQAANVAEHLRLAIEQTQFALIDRLTISLGVATQTDSDHSQTLLKRADDMLYLAKQHGRNRVETDQLATFSTPTT
jgi:diguanylate cyclase (GGDEF)-like protein